MRRELAQTKPWFEQLIFPQLRKRLPDPAYSYLHGSRPGVVLIGTRHLSSATYTNTPHESFIARPCVHVHVELTYTYELYP